MRKRTFTLAVRSQSCLLLAAHARSINSTAAMLYREAASELLTELYKRGVTVAQ